MPQTKNAPLAWDALPSVEVSCCERSNQLRPASPNVEGSYVEMFASHLYGKPNIGTSHHLHFGSGSRATSERGFIAPGVDLATRGLRLDIPELRTKPRLPLQARTRQAAVRSSVTRQGRAGPVTRYDLQGNLGRSFGRGGPRCFALWAEGTVCAVTNRTGDRATPPEELNDWPGSIHAAPGEMNPSLERGKV